MQFENIAGLTNAHLGCFWQSLGADWPHVEDAAPIEPTFERFDEEQLWAPDIFKLRVSSERASRIRVRDEKRSAMIQVQRDRLHYNWVGSGQEYPRYEAVLPKYRELAKQFSEFLQARGLGPLRPNQWELTYVNNILQGTVWDTPADWPRVLPGLLGNVTAASTAAFENVGGTWRYEIAPRAGRLHVELTHVRVGAASGPHALRLVLTARGPADGIDAVFAGLNKGHTAIVTMFSEITSQAAHAFWERVVWAQ
ncbi:hypothetical protein RAS1_11490 [Phycisphaerae bacterium RAS1]|nr:hypothetical protein RAS1_11490 [Phycisphaerae bacterium RAS1]